MKHDCQSCAKWDDFSSGYYGVCERMAQHNYLLNIKNKQLSTREFIDCIIDSITCCEDSCMFWAGCKCDM
ncbi:hypothetical protein ABG984_05790 [Collinsella aerofaciens]|jgi:hypothetical protein|uniref:hypothetical protein n=1 Tax=Collinsella aerofaciens TaxID=74426 RepID=UPI00325C22CC